MCGFRADHEIRLHASLPFPAAEDHRICLSAILKIWKLVEQDQIGSIILIGGVDFEFDAIVGTRWNDDGRYRVRAGGIEDEHHRAGLDRAIMIVLVESIRLGMDLDVAD